MKANKAMRWRCGGRDFSPMARPLIMGIVNVTPDSFSDGGRFATARRAVARGLKLLADGADLIDVGGESTRPGAAATTAAEEKRRVLPVIEELAKNGAVVSADTMKPDIMRAALQAGAMVINDVNGFRADGAVAAVAGENCGLIVMHMRGRPQTMQRRPRYGDVVAEVGDFLRSRLEDFAAAGVAADRVCVDPGIGFGKTTAHNVALLNGLPRLAPGRPVMVGVSRKSLFAAAVEGAPPAARDSVSATTAALLAGRGAHIFRVHDVEMTKRALAAGELLATG